MKFRPCIDIHNGQVKQIVGGTLKDTGNYAAENFVAENGGAFYAELYREKRLNGGHIIMLNSRTSEYFPETKRQAMEALAAYPGGLQIGGGIDADNAQEYLKAGASHVIVTSYVFKNGQIYYENLQKLKAAVGKEHLVLDLSCRKKENDYYIVTDRWQKFTDVRITLEQMEELSEYCDEFLIHAVDVEGKAQGIEQRLVQLLSDFAKTPVTYAGGVGNFEDLQQLKAFGKGRIDVTIGSALDLFGEPMNFEKILEFIGN